MSRRAALGWGAGAACLGVGLVACPGARPWRLGFLGGLSGRVSDLGVGGRNGAQLAVEGINAAGGVQGRPIELLVRDDEQSNQVGLQRLQELAEAGVQLVIGPMTSSVAVAITPWATERGLVLISPTATTHELSGRTDAFYRVVPDATSGARHEMGYLHQQGFRRLATVADLSNRAFSQSWVQGARERFVALGGRVVAEVHFSSAPGVSYSDPAAQLVAAQPDVVVIVANATDTAMLVQQVRHRDTKIQLATSPWSGTETLLQMGGRAVEGCIVPQYHDLASESPAYVEMAKRFRERFGAVPGFPAVNAYDATTMAALALRLSAQGQPLQAAMRGLRAHNGVQRPLVLDEHGDCASPLFLTRVVDGRYEPVVRP